MIIKLRQPTMKAQKIITTLAIIAISGCATTGENLRGNVYKAKVDPSVQTNIHRV